VTRDWKLILAAARRKHGKDALRYVSFIKYRWRWRPKGGTKRMRALGFRITTLGKELDAAALAKAKALNDDWDRLRVQPIVPIEMKWYGDANYPPGTIGYAFDQAIKLRARLRKNVGKTWEKDQEKRDDWARALKRFEQFELADCDPATLEPKAFLQDDGMGGVKGLIPDLEAVSPTERHRVIKTWRALCKLMAKNKDILGAGQLLTGPDPSLSFPNRSPPTRKAFWLFDEVVSMVDHAWATERKGLSALMAVTWDTMMSPIDVRTLMRSQMRSNPQAGIYFAVERTKTGRAGAGTLTPWSEDILAAYLTTLNVEPLDDMPLFWTPGTEPGPKGGRRYKPQPYSKKLMEEHFADVRREVFGENGRDARKLADFRRSGAIEGDAGGASVEDQANKMANRVDANEELRRRYNPINLPSIKRYDASRMGGREALRQMVLPLRLQTNQNQTGNKDSEKVSPRRPVKVSPRPLGGPKSLI
jgi:hypothetical protein